MDDSDKNDKKPTPFSSQKGSHNIDPWRSSKKQKDLNWKYLRGLIRFQVLLISERMVLEQEAWASLESQGDDLFQRLYFR